jgi:hypothetical protein
LNVRPLDRRGLEVREVEIAAGERIDARRIAHHATSFTLGLLPLRSRSTTS